MPSPIRIPPDTLITAGFCRSEIQKVFKKHVRTSTKMNKTLRAKNAFTAFAILAPKLSTFSQQAYPRLKEGSEMQRSLNGFLLSTAGSHPMFVGELLVAFGKSRCRLSHLPWESPEKAVEYSGKSLLNVDAKRKLAEALPRLNEEQLKQVRTWLAQKKKVVAYWLEILLSEAEKDVEDEGPAEWHENEIVLINWMLGRGWSKNELPVELLKKKALH